MGDASFIQSNFLGGEWSPYAQGRADKETYRTALNLCYNGLPVEEGAWVRRPGTLFAATTRNGLPGILRNFDFNQSSPYSLEFTASHMRLFAGLGLVLTDQHAVAAITAATPAVMVLPVAADYATGDQVQFNVTPRAGVSPSTVAPLFNRQFSLTKIDSQHFSLSDPVTGAAINGSTINTDGWVITVARVLDIATPYLAADLQALRLVQDDTLALLLHGSYPPHQIQNVGDENTQGFNELAFGVTSMFDGPYLDPPTDGSTMTGSTTSSLNIEVTASSPASINNGLGFLSTDVGRMIRLFSEPLNWAKATAYSAGDFVKYAGVYWQALTGSTGKEPDTSVTAWAITTTAAAWTWGTITSIIDTTHADVTLATADPYGVNAGGELLYANAMQSWQLGVYSNTTGWPTGGTYHEGRFWLFSAVKNRFDATMADNGGIPEGKGLQFSPTAIDDTVADDNGISATLKATNLNVIFWMEPDHQGIVVGTQAGEWLISASNLNDPLTPSSVQAHRVTKYGCANVLPQRTGLSLCFIHRYQRKLYEYIADVYSGKFSGTNLAINAQHLTSPCSAIEEIAYVVERAPVVWARMGDGSLKGMTYKRESPFGTQPASFFGWHQHVLGSGRLVESLQSGPMPDGNTDTLAMITNDPATGIRYVEFLSPIFDENSAITTADFVDAAVTPAGAEIVGGDIVRFWGLGYIAGKTVTAMLGGIDNGDHVVQADGHVDIPLPSLNGLLTTSYLQASTGNGCGSTNLNLQIQVTPPGQGFFSPVGAALNYVTASNAAAHGHIGTFDWDKGLFYQEQAWNGTTDPETNGSTLFVFNIATQAQVGGPIDPGEWAFAGLSQTCLGYDGNIYYGTGDSTNLVGQFNTTSHVNVTYNDTHSLAAAGFVAPIVDSAGNDYVLTTGVNSGQGGGGSAPWYIVQMTGAGAPQWTGAGGSFDEGSSSLSPGNAFPCRGPVGRAYIGVYGQLSPWTGAAQLGLYQAAVDAPTIAGVVKLGSILATAVDAGWTTIGINSMVFDETDGNVLLAVAGSGNSNTYLIKLSTRDGSLMWSLLNFGGLDFRTSRVRGGRMSYVAGGSNPRTLYEIDTIAGTATAGPTESVIAPNVFSTDDKAGQIVVQVNDIGATQWATFGPANGGGAITPAVTYSAPAILGFNYASQGQILRALAPGESGARNGPALGKTRRNHQMAVLLSQTQGISFGTDFSGTMRPAILTSPGGTITLPLNTLYAGVYWAPVEDDYSFDGMLAWEITRPYPAAVLAIEAYLHTQDR